MTELCGKPSSVFQTLTLKLVLQGAALDCRLKSQSPAKTKVHQVLSIAVSHPVGAAWQSQRRACPCRRGDASRCGSICRAAYYEFRFHTSVASSPGIPAPGAFTNWYSVISGV